MALAIVWRNPRFSQPKRMCIPASSNGRRSVFLIVESVSVAKNEWNGLPNIEVIAGRAKPVIAAPNSQHAIATLKSPLVR